MISTFAKVRLQLECLLSSRYQNIALCPRLNGRRGAGEGQENRQEIAHQLETEKNAKYNPPSSVRMWSVKCSVSRLYDPVVCGMS